MDERIDTCEAPPPSSASKPFRRPYSLKSTIKCDQGAVRRVRLTADNAFAITCGVDKTIKLWNPKRQLFLKSYLGHGYEVSDAAGSCDNAQLCSGSADKLVLLWDVATGKTTRRWRYHLGAVNVAMFNETSQLVLSGSFDSLVACWDTRAQTREPVQKLKEASDSVVSLDVSDHEIVSGSLDGRVRRYDLRACQCVEDAMPASICSVCMTHDGQCLLVSTLDSRLRLIDKSNNAEPLGEYRGHSCRDYAIECSMTESDTHLVSGSEDGAIYVWDLLSGEVVQRLEHPPGYRSQVVSTLAHHSKERMLVSANEGRMFVWAADDDAE